MNIEMVPMRDLKPYKGNARTHSKKQIKQIAHSIRTFGFTNPVLAADDGSIIAGHGRVAAARLIDMQEVPVVRLSHLSEVERRAYVIADNKLAMNAGWDREILAIELQGLIDLDLDISLSGFEIAEIDLILDEAKEAAEDTGPEDIVPEGGPAVSRPGDLWILGKHRLLCGDALADDSYATVMDGAKAGFVFTDPPYNVPIQGHVGGKGRIRHREFAMASGEMRHEEFVAFLHTVFKHLVAHSTDGSIHDICMDWRHMGAVLEASAPVYGKPKNLCVWNKDNAGMGSFYRSKHELVFVFKNGDAAHINTFELGQHGRSRTNVWDYAGATSAGKARMDALAMHPTVKPVALVADAIKDCSRRNGIVLDPFCGSGTILIAAERTGRRARAIEIDPIYVDTAVRRWQNYTGKTATLAGTTQTFEDVEAERTSMINASPPIDDAAPAAMQGAGAPISQISIEDTPTLAWMCGMDLQEHRA